jgi:hypothetical protein
MKLRDQVTDAEIVDTKWNSLYQAGGWAALVIGALFIIEMIIYIASSAPSLADAAGWLALFQNNRLLGLVDFGILEFYGLILFVPIYLALYAALKRTSESYVSIAAILAFVGIAINFATSKLFPMLSLSDLYASPATDVQRSQFLAAAQAALAQGAQGGIGGGVEGGVPLAVAGLIFSAVVLRSGVFGKATGYIGILANGIGLVMYVRAAAVTALEGSPLFGLFFILSILWFFLIARGLLQLGQPVRAGAK